MKASARTRSATAADRANPRRCLGASWRHQLGIHSRIRAGIGAFATVAHVITLPNQWLQDNRQLALVNQDEMLYGLALGIDDLLLHDSTGEDGAPCRGC